MERDVMMIHECMKNDNDIRIYYTSDSHLYNHNNLEGLNPGWVIDLYGEEEFINYCPFCGIKLDTIINPKWTPIEE
jgi:hypothetical protein